MSEKAIIAQRFVLDLGPYAAALALFAAWVSWRANPLRAVNRYFAAFLLGIAIWQVNVAMARSTQHFWPWGVVAAPFGSFFGLMIFFLNDAVIEPNARLWQRVRRTPSAIILLALTTIGAALAWVGSSAPAFYPYSYRVVCALLIGFILVRAGASARQHLARINPHELILFRLSASFLIIIYSLFMLVRRPIGSRIASGVAILFATSVVAMQLSERVLDARGSAKIALGYLLTILVHAVLTLIPIAIFLLAGGELTGTTMWGFLALGALLSYPVFTFAQTIIRRNLSSLTARAAKEAHEAAVEIAGKAETEKAVVNRITELSKSFLKGQDVTIELFSPHLHEAGDANAERLFLAKHARRGWLSPEGALRQYRGKTLDHLLEVFHDKRIGATIVHSGPRFSLVMFVSERSGGTKPITGEEIECLQEMAAIAATGIERVRALDHAFRAHGMAQVGRIAAQFSHESRNQIEAIICVLEALRDGYENRITPPHRLAVYQQAVDLAANHNLALEMVRLRPERVDLKPTDLHAAALQSAAPFRNGEVKINVTPAALPAAYADARLLRQVLLNLFRNSIQAALAARTPVHIDVQFGVEDDFVFVDVSDRGPGVPAGIHHSLFERWITTKTDGTGLGLAFCREAMNAMKGDIYHLTPKGEPGARFRLALPAEIRAGP